MGTGSFEVHRQIETSNNNLGITVVCLIDVYALLRRADFSGSWPFRELEFMNPTLFRGPGRYGYTVFAKGCWW